MTDSEHQHIEIRHDEFGSDAPPALGGKARAATFDDLRKKNRRKAEFTVTSIDDDGEKVELVIRYRAIGSADYDRLVAAHPPTAKQAKDGAQYNFETFGPALVAAVSYEPKLSVEEAKELFGSDEWASGEITSLFMNALRLQNSGIDVPFIGGD